MMSELGRETVVGYASAKGGLKMLTKNICSEFGEKIFSVMVLVQATLLHLKQHRYVKFNQMAAAIHLISLLYQKRQLDAGVNQMILLVQLYFSIGCFKLYQWSYFICRWWHSGLHWQTALVIFSHNCMYYFKYFQRGGDVCI